MAMLTNTPAQETPLILEARKSFSLGMWFKTLDREPPRNFVDVTGATVTLIIAQPVYAGGTVLLTKVAVMADPVIGYVRFDVQAADFNFAAGTYPYSVTLKTAENYSSVVMKGEIELLENTNLATTGTYAAANPSQAVTVELSSRNQVTVRVNALSASDLEIGAVSTLASGELATASISGTYPYQQLNLALPRGLQGAAGVGTTGGQGIQGIQGLQGIPGQDGLNSTGGTTTSSRVALDTDGVPYFDLAIPVETSRVLQADTDGVPYFV